MHYTYNPNLQFRLFINTHLLQSQQKNIHYYIKFAFIVLHIHRVWPCIAILGPFKNF